jgi:hypothetical protein
MEAGEKEEGGRERGMEGEFSLTPSLTSSLPHSLISGLVDYLSFLNNPTPLSPPRKRGTRGPLWGLGAGSLSAALVGWGAVNVGIITNYPNMISLLHSLTPLSSLLGTLPRRFLNLLGEVCFVIVQLLRYLQPFLKSCSCLGIVFALQMKLPNLVIGIH